MKYLEIDIDKLYISDVNVRKTLETEEDETGISDLANDIRENGLINPITVRLDFNGKYEIIAGQRRFLAVKLLKNKLISCHIIDVSTQKAEEISLVENVQRNQMTTLDKVKSYTKLYIVYNGDIDKVINSIHISRTTLQKYLKIKELPDNILNLLDKSGEEKITIDVAIELTKLPKNINPEIVIKEIQTLTSQQKISAIKTFISKDCENIKDLQDIKEDIAIQQNNIKFAPSFPYVIDDKNDKYVRIPELLYKDIINLIQNKQGYVEYV